MRTWRILKTLSGKYDGAFSTEPHVTLAYLEVEAYSEPRKVSIMENIIQNHVQPWHI